MFHFLLIDSHLLLLWLYSLPKNFMMEKPKSSDINEDMFWWLICGLWWVVSIPQQGACSWKKSIVVVSGVVPHRSPPKRAHAKGRGGGSLPLLHPHISNGAHIGTTHPEQQLSGIEVPDPDHFCLRWDSVPGDICTGSPHQPGQDLDFK